MVHGKIGFESKTISQYFYENLAQGLELEPCDGIIEELRIIKDEEEIKAIKESIAVNHKLFEWLPSTFQENKSEAELALEIETFFRKHGATENSFAPIVAINKHAARPHHIPDQETKITENCHILIDVGARYKNYCSDQTRTFWFGDTMDSAFKPCLNKCKKPKWKP